MKKTFSSEVKLRAVVELLKGQKSSVEIANQIGCHPTILKKWKERFLSSAPHLFETEQAGNDQAKHIEELERIIGKLTIQNDFLKKVSESWESR